jgi:hypothetical protein
MYDLVFISPELRLPVPLTDLDTIRGATQAAALERFRAEHGRIWKLWLDERRNAAGLLTGGAIPFIPGAANDLKWADFAPAPCGRQACIPPEKMEQLTRGFLVKYRDLLGVDPGELELVRENLGPVEHMYFVSYRQVVDGLPVEGSTVNFRINGGNLIQVATENVAPVIISTTPEIGPEVALEAVTRHVGDFPSSLDTIVDRGSLVLLPCTRRGMDPDAFAGPPGTGYGHILAYRVAFRREGVSEHWEAYVDAHSGELIAFLDAVKYGVARGAVYPADGHVNPAYRVFAFAHLSDGTYTNAAGYFPGDTATLDFEQGKYVHIADTCGPTTLTTTDGDADFGQSIGMDCGVPSPNPGGGGNTWSSKVQMYHLTAINIKARSYYPTHPWLNNNYMIANVNGAAWCNAIDTCPGVCFYKTDPPCWNLGEIPGITLHEWSHWWDDLDGSGSTSPPLETRCDWTAALMIRESCTARGAGFTFCGYGDPCPNCDGVREADYWRHTSQQPWKASTHTSWGPCTGGGYFAPCGGEDHCESGMATQALWDMVKGPAPSAGPQGDFFLECGLDGPSGWFLMDRLWWTSHLNLSNMYSCTSWVTNGCNANGLYTLFMAIDDDGDGTGNGTPHAHGIFHALNRHEIACGTDASAENQDHANTACPTLVQPQNVQTLALSNRVDLSWDAVPGATRYDVYRNDGGCEWAFMRIAQPTGTTYSDAPVANDFTYYYRVQPVVAGGGCSAYGPVSECVPGTPQPCSASVSLDRTIYNCNDTVNVTVLDSTPGSGPWTAQVWSTTDPTVKTFALAQNPPGGATYTGMFYTVPSGAGADQVNVADGATITVRFTDPDFCGTGSSNVDVTVPVDCMGPLISNVQVINITDSTATVTWTTNESANSRVTYGTSTPPGTVQSNLTTFGTSHGLALSGLTPCTAYYFSVTSADVAGNGTTDTNGGSYYTFTTQGAFFAMGPFDVESGTTGWTLTGQWRQDTCKAHGGSYAFKVGSATCPGTYANSTTSDLTWNSNITLGAAGHGFHLKYWEYYQTESGYDYCRPQISTNGGTTWTTLGTQYAGTGTTWALKDFDLAAYTGNQIRIRFEFYTDSSVVYEGWYVDDIKISKSAGCSTDVRYVSHTFTDTCTTGGPGNGNGILEPGEDAVTTITAVNGGMVGATNVTGTLSTSTPGVTVTTATAGFPDMAALGGTGTSIAPHFAVHVDGAVTCVTTVNFVLHTVTTENPTGSDSYFTMNVGQAGGAVTAFAENFSGVTPPALPMGWTISSTSGNNWVTNATGCAANALMYPYNGTAAANSWAYTPGIALQMGTTYTLNFDQRVYLASYPEIFEVRCGTAATPAGQTITILASAGYTNTTCMARAPTFTVPTTGTYYLGFHCTSAANMWNLYMDNINLTYPTVPVCNVCLLSSAPPPVNNTGSEAAKFTKGMGDLLDVTYDAVTCSSEKVIILYGNIGTWTGYEGCALTNGGNSGSTLMNSSGQSNVWYNIVWTSGTTAGHPGFATSGARTWTVGTLCGMTTDDASHSSCP